MEVQSSTVYLLILAGPVLVLLWYWTSRRTILLLSSSIPGPPGLPFVGNLLSLLGPNHVAIKTIRTWGEKYHPTWKMWLGPYLFIFVSKPRDLEILMSSKKCLGRKLVNDAFEVATIGEGLSTLSGEKWVRHRKIIVPAFKMSVLKTYIDVFGKKAQILADVLEPGLNDPGTASTLLRKMSCCTLDMVCETIMGVNMDIQLNGCTAFLDAIDELKRFAFDYIRRPWFLIFLMFKNTEFSKRFSNNTANLWKFVDLVIESKINKSKCERMNADKNEQTDGHGWKRDNPSFLELLIETGGNKWPVLPYQEIRQEVMNIIISGFETTDTATCFALSLLGFHQEVQEKAFCEVADIFGDDMRRLPTHQDLAAMTYLEQVIKETLRLYPPISFIPREVEEEIQITDHTIPIGSSVVFNLFSSQRNPEYFPNPDRFNPDRFSPEARHKFPTHAFTPFSDGYRMCIGSKLAMFQMKILLSTLLRRYHVTSEGKLEDLEQIEFTVSIAPLKGFKVCLEPRNNERDMV